ncbi:Ganglioside-induced differentiation-associated protein 1-like 1 [Takifugu flavidus]|uniref:Ganglioside-induced differentiation-associated protein 1-like 1 n=1 Tax=Takifugu flavidus TaxID=433684 RepID=A0A5C6MSQ9_9TELE|nr:Ganglioside-induced differentiation-associated protein 1-like 1 [Takifugu flavidus]
MRLNLGEEVPVFLHGDTIISDYNQIIDYLEKTFVGAEVAEPWNPLQTVCGLQHEAATASIRAFGTFVVTQQRQRGLMFNILHDLQVHHGLVLPLDKHVPNHLRLIVTDKSSASDHLQNILDSVAQLIPDAESPLYGRVQQYRQLLDALPMDAYTHGCILHPELTTDSMIPKYATAEIRRHLANAATELMKLDHEEPQLTEPYLSKQKKLMKRNHQKEATVQLLNFSPGLVGDFQAKILDHDNVNYLKKILGELSMVLDQVEAELEKRKLEYQGQKCELWLCGPEFTLADVCLGALLHRLKFLGLSRKYWEDGSRANLQSFFTRVQKRYAFRKVLGDIHTTLLSAVLPNAFRLVKKKPPSFFGASFLMGSLGGMGYFAYWFLKKKYM